MLCSYMGILLMYIIHVFIASKRKRNVWKMAHVARIYNILETAVNQWFAIDHQGHCEWLLDSHSDVQVRIIGLCLWQETIALIIVKFMSQMSFYLNKREYEKMLSILDTASARIFVNEAYRPWFDISVIAIIHYYWWTASIKPRLLFSRAGYASWGLSLSSVLYHIFSNMSAGNRNKILYFAPH